MTDDEKIQIATYVVNNNGWNLYDEQGGAKIRCPACKISGSCTGHYGVLYLQTTVVHPFFFSKIPKKSKEELEDLYNDPEYEKILMKTILVPPPGLRSNGDMEWKNRITALYEDIIEFIKKERYERIQDKITELFGAKNKSGIMEYLGTKDGIFRKIVFGKRINSSGRSVITGDPFIDPTEIVIPKGITKNLYMKCIVDDMNGIYYSSKDFRITKIRKGMQCLRLVRNGDLVFVNRQPTLSYGSLFTFKAKLAKDDIKTIRIHPNVTKTFNADFDGDEMNIFCFPQCLNLQKAFIGNFPDHINDIQDSKTMKYLGIKKNEFDLYGLTVSLEDLLRKRYERTGLQAMVESKAKGSLKNVEQIMEKVGDQYLGGKFIGKIESSYLKGLTQDEFFIHQKASREGIVSTGVSTSDTGYINRTGTTMLSDVISGEKYIEDNFGIIDFYN